MKSIPRGSDNYVDKSKPSIPTPRVLRKRRCEEESKEYCEISSDEELDDYSLMMNAIHDNYDEIFTDE